MVKKVNPYVQVYYQAGDMIRERPVGDIHLVFKTTGTDIDPRRFNLPTGTDVALIIPTETQDA